MQLRKLCAGLLLCASAGVANAELAWDGVIQVPAAVTEYHNLYLVCPVGTVLRQSGTCDIRDKKLWGNMLAPAPSALELQQILDMYYTKAPPGLKAEAKGIMPVTLGRYGPETSTTVLTIAYKLVRK